MQIQSVNFSYGTSKNQAKIQNFKGLWGKTSIESDIDEGLGCFVDRETYYYYPFIGESSSRINHEVRKNTFDYIDESGSKPRYVIKECKVCVTLPFKESIYKNYLAADLSAPNLDELRKIHVLLKDKYVNNQLEEQVSAKNENLSKVFDQNA